MIDTHELFRLYCKSTKQWGLLISFWHEGDDYKEILKAAPYLNFHDDGQVIIDGQGYFFGTQEEVNRRYNLTVGDDGPTATNPYDGPARVYALTCDDAGVLRNENT